MEPENREDTGRNEDGTFKAGVSGNPGGRPKNSLKDYVKKKLSEMTPEEKEEFLKSIPADMQWRMSEGNPAQSTDVNLSGEVKGVIALPIKDGHLLETPDETTPSPNQ